MIGIYLIKNLVNDKKYVGKSSNIMTRWVHHKTDLRYNCHHNRHLQFAWNKYGEENFEFSVIEECSIDDLNSKESYWINFYDSYNNGYNMDKGGDGTYGYKHTKEEIDKMRRIQNPNIVLQFDEDFNFIKRWIGGVSHVKSELGGTKECYLIRCNHVIKNMSLYNGFYWVYEEEYYHKDFTWEKYLRNEKIAEIKKKNKKECRKICQYDLNRNLVKIWDSYSDLRDAGYNTSQISGICHQSRGKKTACGYIWTFEGYDFSDGYFDVIDKYYNKAIENRKRKVAKLNDQKEIVFIYNSLTEAAKENNVCVSNITVAAKSNKTKKSGGFYWEYINE